MKLLAFSCLFLLALPALGEPLLAPAHAFLERGSVVQSDSITREFYAQKRQWSWDQSTLTVKAVLAPGLGLNGGYLQLPGIPSANPAQAVVTPIPSRLFKDLSASYRHQLSTGEAWFVTAKMPGSPVFGPEQQLARMTGPQGQIKPRSLHWITGNTAASGALVAGFQKDQLRFDTSLSSQQAFPLGLADFDAHTARVSFNASPELRLQASHGWLDSPGAAQEALQRSSVSAVYRRESGERRFEAMLAWGQREQAAAGPSDAYLLDTSLRLRDTHAVFGRLERFDGLPGAGPDHAAKHSSNMVSLGYEYSRSLWDRLSLRIGVVQNLELAASEDDSQMAFLRLGLN